MKRNRVAVALVAIGVIAAAVVVMMGWPGADPNSSAPSANRSPKVSETADGRAPLMSVSDKSVTFEVPQNAYVSTYDRETRKNRPPEPADSGPLVQTTSDKTAGHHITVFVTDERKKIEDVMVLGNFVLPRQVAKLQWVMTKDGVELAWDADGFSDWTVKRNEIPITTDGDGHYFDPVPVTEATRYVVTRVEKVEIEVDGKTVMADEPTSYIALMPLYDDSLLGKNIDTIGSRRSPGVVPQRPASMKKAAAVEYALFVEWNSFIPDDFIDAPGLCLQNVFLGFDLFKGDNRGFLNSPASEGFTARGTPRSRMSTRVGASWSREVELR